MILEQRLLSSTSKVAVIDFPFSSQNQVTFTECELQMSSKHSPQIYCGSTQDQPPALALMIFSISHGFQLMSSDNLDVYTTPDRDFVAGWVKGTGNSCSFQAMSDAGYAF